MRRIVDLPRRLLARAQARLHGDAGMNTVEYAVGTIAAAGFAAVLYEVVTSDRVNAALGGIIQRALG